MGTVGNSAFPLGRSFQWELRSRCQKIKGTEFPCVPAEIKPCHDGNFGDDRWKIATCRAFNSFCVTDSLTHTHSFLNLSNAANALGRQKHIHACM